MRIFSITLLLFSINLLLYPQKVIEADGLRIKLDKHLGIVSLGEEEEFIAGDLSYLISIKSGNDILYPIKTKWENDRVKVSFNNDISLSLTCVSRGQYIRIEVVDVQNPAKIDVLYYGPFNNHFDETIGEIVGVVRENGYAIGLQALNAKTTGGKMNNPDGSDPARGTTATKEDHGSSLQAYCINRNKERVYNIWNNRIPDALIPANPDGDLVGSAIALFGCPEADVLDVLEHIEIEEGLPYSTVNGVWSKRSIDANKPYFITTFTEQNIDEVLSYTEKLGFNAVYHGHPFSTWGHFDLIEEQFPNGWDGMKACVEKANARGIRLGAHTLTNFLTTNDKFVTPIPDKNLMIFAETELSRSLSPGDTEIYIEDTSGYAFRDALKALRIGDEIIRYQKVSEDTPLRLLNCKRGEFGTIAADHSKGTAVARLADHAYKTLFPNFTMQKELISKLADFFNYTGVGQLDFDGHEGGWGTGEGEFGMDYFSEQLQKEVGHELRNGSSRSNHYYWHTVSYLNWGEPWYGGFTKSQGHYRYQNQALLKRNYIPNMLGWFLLNPTTTLQEFEYMLARSAGYDAGYALYSDINSFKQNDEFDEIAEAINTWEEARLRKIFNKEQLEVLKDVNNDFSLYKIDENTFKLRYYTKEKFELLNQPVQPGQPNDRKVEFSPDRDQELYFVIGAVGEKGSISNIRVEINGFETITIENELKPNWAVTYRGDDVLLVYDEVGRFNEELSINSSGISLEKGPNSIRVSCDFADGSDIRLEGYVRLKDRVETIIVTE
jgi:hypothetical protein